MLIKRKASVRNKVETNITEDGRLLAIVSRAKRSIDIPSVVTADINIET